MTARPEGKRRGATPAGSTASSSPRSRRICPRCGAAFTCDLLAGKKTCWCTAYPPLLAVPDPSGECLCPACLEKAVEEARRLREGGQ